MCKLCSCKEFTYSTSIFKLVKSCGRVEAAMPVSAAAGSGAALSLTQQGR
jgi:hypothetical protein